MKVTLNFSPGRSKSDEVDGNMHSMDVEVDGLPLLDSHTWDISLHKYNPKKTNVVCLKLVSYLRGGDGGVIRRVKRTVIIQYCC